MSDIAIKVENLSKLYRIGQREPYKSLRERIWAHMRQALQNWVLSRTD
jgi:hypothetical protein